MKNKILNIDGLVFKPTCPACPEQYNVMDEYGNPAGYVRLRNGKLRCDFPDYGMETIYSHSFENKSKGAFDDDDEKIEFLLKIAKTINKKRSQQ